MKGSKPFRTSKKKVSINFIIKKENNYNNEIEPIIPKQGFIPAGINKMNNNINLINNNNNKDEELMKNEILEEFEE